jgi:hypothetical protein
MRTIADILETVVWFMFGYFTLIDMGQAVRIFPV